MIRSTRKTARRTTTRWSWWVRRTISTWRAATATWRGCNRGSSPRGTVSTFDSPVTAAAARFTERRRCFVFNFNCGFGLVWDGSDSDLDPEFIHLTKNFNTLLCYGSWFDPYWKVGFGSNLIRKIQISILIPPPSWGRILIHSQMKI